MPIQATNYRRIFVCGIALLILQPASETRAQSINDEVGAPEEEWQGPTLRARVRVFGSYESVETPASAAEDDRLDDTYFRRADLTIRGSLSRNLSYYMKNEFKEGELDIRDAYLAYDAGPITIRAGYLDPIDELITPAYREFMEVSATEGFPPDNQLGIGLSHEADTWTLFVAALKHTIDRRHFERAGTMYSTRFTMAPPVPEGYLLHIGAYASWREADRDQELFSYSARSMLRTGERFVDTGPVADEERLLGIELVGSVGSFSLESQCAVVRASLPSGTEPDADLHGCYLAGIWNITGEMRNYDGGGFSLIRVNRPVFQGGPGTWQTGLRYESIDLTDGAIQGGGQDTWVFALNWYLSRNFWISGNYSRTRFRDNAYDGIDIDGLGFRLQTLVEF